MGKKEIFCYSLRLKNPDAINILNYLRNHNSDLSVNAIISRALIAIGPNGLDVVGNNRMTIEKEDKIRSSKANTELRKKMWIEEFGGTIDDDGIIRYEKYEETPTGYVVQTTRTDTMANFPSTRDEIKKAMITVYKSLKDAREALVNKPMP